MAKKAPAKKAAKKVAAKPAKKATTAAKAPVKKAIAKPPKKPAPKPPKAPPPKKPPAARSGEGGSVTFTVRVSATSLTLEYEGGEPQDFNMLLFVKDEEQARRAQDCIDAMGLRKLVVGVAKAYGNP